MSTIELILVTFLVFLIATMYATLVGLVLVELVERLFMRVVG